MALVPVVVNISTRQAVVEQNFVQEKAGVHGPYANFHIRPSVMRAGIISLQQPPPSTK